MRRRRHTPYSQIEALRHSQRELLLLVLLTICLGIVLNLFAGLLGVDLLAWIPAPIIRYVLVGGLAVALAALAAALVYAHSESRWVQIEIHVPYHWPAEGQPRIAERKSYGVTAHARRAFMRRYRRDSTDLQDWLAAWRRAEEEGTSFPQFIAHDNAALVQCLVLYALHRHGDDSLGPEAAYGWRKVDLPARQLTMDDLPPGLRDNRFLRADQRAGEWRLWWPADVQIELDSPPLPPGERVGVRGEPALPNPFPSWRLRHRRYGHVEIRCFPPLSVAGRGSEVWQVLTQRLKPDRRSRLTIVGTRLEARACFRWTFWPGGDAFHDWATGLLAYLEEALDWGYYLNTRTDRLVALLDERIGWVPHGTSLFEKLQEIEGRLERIEVQDSRAAETRLAREEPPAEGEALVV